MQFVQERINFFKNPPLIQPFHKINMIIAKFISSGAYPIRYLKVCFIIFPGCFILIPYILLYILNWIDVYCNNKRAKVNQLIIKKLEEMYFKSLIEVAPFIDQKVLENARSSDSLNNFVFEF